MHQYKKGIESMTAGILKYPCCIMKYFIVENVNNWKLLEIKRLIKFTALGNKEYIEKKRQSLHRVISCGIRKRC